MKKQNVHNAFYLCVVAMLLALVSFSSLTYANHANFDIDLASVEIEPADLDVEETTNYNDVVYSSLADIWANVLLKDTKPITFSSSTGFHANTPTGKSICIVYRQLKFEC